MEFLKEIKERLGDHDPSQIDELVLDELFNNISEFNEDHKQTLELYDNLLHLSLNGLGLKSLANFPKIETLEVLEIRKNNLTGADFENIKSLYPKLYKLKVGDNPIKSLDVFKVLAGTQIKKVELKSTDAAKKSTYRNDLFSLIPSLTTVDNFDKKGSEVESTLYEDEDDEAEFDEMGEEDDFGEDEELEGEEGEMEEDEELEEESEEEETPNNKKTRKD